MLKGGENIMPIERPFDMDPADVRKLAADIHAIHLSATRTALAGNTGELAATTPEEASGIATGAAPIGNNAAHEVFITEASIGKIDATPTTSASIAPSGTNNGFQG